MGISPAWLEAGFAWRKGRRRPFPDFRCQFPWRWIPVYAPLIKAWKTVRCWPGF